METQDTTLSQQSAPEELPKLLFGDLLGAVKLLFILLAAIAGSCVFAVATTNENPLYISVSVTIAAVCGMILLFRIRKKILIQQEQATLLYKLFAEVQSKNFSAKAQKITEENLGDIANSLNEMLYILTKEIENDNSAGTTQEKFMQLLVDISSLDKGDLRVRSEIAEDAGGGIARSFNSIADRFCTVIDLIRKVSCNMKYVSSMLINKNKPLVDHALEQAKATLTTTLTINNAINDNLHLQKELNPLLEQLTKNAPKQATGLTEQSMGHGIEQWKQTATEYRNYLLSQEKMLNKLLKAVEHFGEVCREAALASNETVRNMETIEAGAKKLKSSVARFIIPQKTTKPAKPDESAESVTPSPGAAPESEEQERGPA